MNLGLKARLFLAALPVVLLFACYNFIHVMKREETLLLGETQRRGETIARLLASRCAYAMQTFNDVLLQSNVNNQFLQEGVVSLQVTDTSGRILAHQDPSLVGQQAQAPQALPEVLQLQADIQIGKRVLGQVQLGLSTAGTQAAVAAARGQAQLSTALLTMGVLLLTVLAADRLARPLVALSQAADRMAEGHLEARASLNDQGDLGVLASTFNWMADKLEARVNAEREAGRVLQERVTRLVEFTARVAQGDLEQLAPTVLGGGGWDELDHLAEGFNGMVASLRELMARQQKARQALEQSAQALALAHSRLSLADKQKSDFLIVVSHELRTPLTSVKAFAELLMDDPDTDEATRKEFLGIIQREADRLTRLINNLLDLSRIEAGRMNWRNDKISLSRLARAAAELAQEGAQSKGVRIEVLVADEREVEGDSERLAQALYQLVQNAVTASAPGEAVRVAAVGGHGSLPLVHLMVEDKGAGIPLEFHEAIFDRFWQIVPEGGLDRERPRGSGLGLPLARAIVQAHGGRIEVESSPGNGSRLHVFLPLREDRPLLDRFAASSLLPLTESLLGKPLDSSRWRDMLTRLLQGSKS